MPLRFPETGHPVYDIFDIEKAKALTKENVGELPTIPEARRRAREIFKGDRTVDYQFFLVRTLANRVMLISIAWGGALKYRWNFGYL